MTAVMVVQWSVRSLSERIKGNTANTCRIAGKATPALRCGRTIARLLLQLFLVFSDIIVNKSKICLKKHSVATVKKC